MPHRLALPRGAVSLLRGLVGELTALHDEPDEDHPAWRRLYPRTTADPRLDRDLRELVHPDLVEGRRLALDVVGSALADADDDADVLDLDDEQAVALLGVLNDVRLALSARIDLPGLLDEHGGALPADLPDATRMTVELVEWMAFLQEQVLSTVAPESQAHFDDPVHDRDGDPDPFGDDAEPASD